MTVVVQTTDRCHLCFSLFARDRSRCCQKRSFHLFKHIQRRRFPTNKLNSYQIHIRNPTVCFRDVILRYLHTQIHQTSHSSNFICYDCSMILLDIEQCAKYLRKTIKQLKVKFNKSNRLRTSSLSATFQKKKSSQVKLEQLPILNSDEDDEFDDMDEEEDSDNEVHVSNDLKSSNQYTSSASSNGTSPFRSKNNKRECNDNGQEGDDEEEEEEEEDGLIRSSSPKSQQQNLTNFFHHLQTNPLSVLSNANGLMNTGHAMNLLEETNPHLLQLRLAQMSGTVNPASNLNEHHNLDSMMMNTFANIQRNFLLQFLNNPAAATQVAAQAAALSATQLKASNIPPISLIPTNNKQFGSGRKRKSTPEKRVLANNNGNTSPTIEHSSLDNNNNSTDHSMEPTIKGLSQSNRVLSSPTKSTTDILNIVMNSKVENGLPSYHQYQPIDEGMVNSDRKESSTPNDSSTSLSPSLLRRATPSKRPKPSTTGQYDYTNSLKITLPQLATTELLSPTHQPLLNDDHNSSAQQKQQRKLDPRSCAECGKVLFSDKTHLLHCQTHAKNEKQCWICGMQEDDIKKHILNEHGNQKFTATGFKCQHCEIVFPVYDDLQAHVREHSKKKPFECPICNKRFGQQGNLSCHLRIHSGVKPFNCTSCGKAFRHSNSLRRHARTVHSASRGLSMSPGSVATTTPSSLLLATASTSNSMVSMANDIHHLSTNEMYDDEPESLQGSPSGSTAGALSPSISNAQIDSDSHEPFGTN